METNQTLVIRQQDIDLIGTSLPSAYAQGVQSHDKCLARGNQLLDAIREHGMDDQLDQDVAKYIGASKATVKKINDLRSPATKLFDQFKKVFTTMEADIDPTKAGSIPNQLQQVRNQYAAKKMEEENRRRQEEARRQQHDRDLQQYRADCEEELRRAFSLYTNNNVNRIAEVFGKITLENFTDSERVIKNYPTALPDAWDQMLTSLVRLPVTCTREELTEARNDVRASLMDQFKENYKATIEGTQDSYVLRLSSKKKELEAIAKQAAENAAEAERLKAEMKAREEAEAAEREAELRAIEEEERKAREAQNAMNEMGGLFDEAKSSVAAYQPKTSVKKKINLLEKEGILPIIGLWVKDAMADPKVTIDDIAKEFKKQITYAEKLANGASPVFIQNEFVEYVDEVKAK